MKIKTFSLIGLLLLPLAGCATREYQGGGYDTYDTGTEIDVSPGPTASPTFRPGMTPNDPRDPHFTTHPEPMQSPPSTNP
jgi:hypothetical protein